MAHEDTFEKLGRVVEEMAANAAKRGAGDRGAALQAVCEMLRESVGHYDWVGLYLADEDSRPQTPPSSMIRG